jgi:hypothetical protein
VANFFDQFDAPAQSGNFFDQFDEKPQPVAPPPAPAPVIPSTAYTGKEPVGTVLPNGSVVSDLPIPGQVMPDGSPVPIEQGGSAYDRYRGSEGNIVDMIMAAGQAGLENAAYAAEGARQGVANTAGLAVDAVNYAPLLANLVPGVSGVGPISEKPVGGSAMLGDWLSGNGLVKPLPETTDPVKRFSSRLGQEIGAASVPMLGTLGAAGRMTAAEAREAPSVLKTLFGIDKAAVDPAKYVGDELRVATGAGTGAGLVAASGNDQGTPLGSLADAGGAVAGAGATGLGTAMIGSTRDLIRAIFGSGNYVDDVVKEAVTDRIIRASGLQQKPGEVVDTDPLVAQIMGGQKVGATIPGFKESLADRTKNPGIAALEYAQQSGPNAGLYNAQRGANTAAVDNAMKPFEPTETPGAFADAAIAERNKRLGEAAVKADAATKAWENSTRSLLPALTAEGRGANIRTALQDASDGAKAVLEQAWAPINGSKQDVDMEALDAIFRGNDSNLSVAEMNRFRPGEADIPSQFIDPGEPAKPTGILDARGKPIMKAAVPPSGEAPLNEITGIRSALTDAAREATTAGRANEARIIGQYIDGIDSYMANNLPDDLRQQYEAARAATVDFNDRFTRPQTAIGQTLSEREGMPRYPDSTVAGKFVQDDQGRIADFEALMKEAGNDGRVQTAVRDQILQDVKDRGLLEKPEALQSYLDGYSNVFAKFPALKAQLGDAKNLRAEMDTATTASSELIDQLTKQGKSAVANYLQYGNENADRAMRGVLSAKDPKKAVDELLTFVGDDPKAVEGARKTFWNIMQKDARSGGRTTGDINGAQPWSPYSLNKFLDDPVNSAVLERLYRANPDHLKNIREIAKAIQGTEVRNGARAANSSGTAQAVHNEQLSPATIQSRLYAYKSGRISGTYLLTSFFATLARKSVGARQTEGITRMLDDVLLNPDAAALLLKENNPANRKALNRWAKTWFGNEASSIINAMSGDDEDTETKAIMDEAD